LHRTPTGKHLGREFWQEKVSKGKEDGTPGDRAACSEYQYKEKEVWGKPRSLKGVKHQISGRGA